MNDSTEWRTSFRSVGGSVLPGSGRNVSGSRLTLRCWDVGGSHSSTYFQRGLRGGHESWIASLPDHPDHAGIGWHSHWMHMRIRSTSLCTVLAVSKFFEHDVTSYAVLNVLKWNFDVERVDVILGHNVEYTGSMSRMPILVLQSSKGEEGHAKQDWNMAFWGGKSGWNGLKFSQKNPDPLAHHFHNVWFLGSSGAMRKHSKTLCPGWEVATFCEATKRERQGDTLTCQQNSLTTVGKSRGCPVSRSSPAVAREGSPDRRHQQ